MEFTGHCVFPRLSMRRGVYVVQRPGLCFDGFVRREAEIEQITLLNLYLVFNVFNSCARSLFASVIHAAGYSNVRLTSLVIEELDGIGLQDRQILAMMDAPPLNQRVCYRVLPTFPSVVVGSEVCVASCCSALRADGFIFNSC